MGTARRGQMAWAVVLLAALAGCVSPSPRGEAPASVLAPIPILVFENCDSRYGFFAVEDAWARARVPSGFGPALPVAGPAPAGSLWALVLSVFACDAVEPVAPAGARGAAWFLAVEAPSELRAEGRETYFALLGLRVDEPATAATFGAWGMPDATADRVTLETALDHALGRVGRATVEDAALQFTLDVASEQATSSGGSNHDRVFLVASDTTGAPTLAGAADFDQEGGNPASGPGHARLASNGGEDAFPQQQLDGFGAWTRGFRMTWTRVSQMEEGTAVPLPEVGP